MKISVRQICFIMLFYTAASRLLQYPTELSEYAGRDLLFSAAVNFALQTAAVWSVAYLSSRTDKTLFKLIEDCLGTVVARVVYGFFAAYFILMAIMPFMEQKQYVNNVFYENAQSVLLFAPVLFFTVYAGAKNFSNIGRCADICLPLFVITYFFIICMSVVSADFGNLLPVLHTPLKSVIGGSAKTFYRFTEPAFLLMFLGHYKYKRGDATKITLSYAGGALLVLLFTGIFYGIYGPLASSRQFSISKASLYFPALDLIGRVDLYALYALEVVMLFAAALYIQLAVHCIIKCANFNKPIVISLCVNVVIAAIVYFCNHYYNGMSAFFGDWLWIATAIFAFVLPFACWALRRKEA